MSNRLDHYLSRAMKGWTSQYKPPAGGRARLLLLASTSSSRTTYTLSSQRYERTSSTRFQLGLADTVTTQIFNNSWSLRFKLA